MQDHTHLVHQTPNNSNFNAVKNAHNNTKEKITTTPRHKHNKLIIIQILLSHDLKGVQNFTVKAFQNDKKNYTNGKHFITVCNYLNHLFFAIKGFNMGMMAK